MKDAEEVVEDDLESLLGLDIEHDNDLDLLDCSIFCFIDDEDAENFTWSDSDLDLLFEYNWEIEALS